MIYSLLGIWDSLETVMGVLEESNALYFCAYSVSVVMTNSCLMLLGNPLEPAMAEPTCGSGNVEMCMLCSLNRNCIHVGSCIQ